MLGSLPNFFLELVGDEFLTTIKFDKRIWFARLVVYRLVRNNAYQIPNLAKFLGFPFRTADVLVSPQIHLVD